MSSDLEDSFTLKRNFSSSVSIENQEVNVKKRKLHKSDFVMLDGQDSKKKPTATMSNMGNTCYLNSVLYALRFVPHFLHSLHHLTSDLSSAGNQSRQLCVKTSSLGRHLTSINLKTPMGKSLYSTSDNAASKSKQQIVTEQLHQLYASMNTLELKGCNKPYQPVAFIEAVKQANNIFEGNHQQDAQEFLLYLLNNITETCEDLILSQRDTDSLLSEEQTPSTSSSNIFRNIKKSGKKNNQKKRDLETELVKEVPIMYSFLREEIQGSLVLRIICRECEGQKILKQPFYDISVPVVSEDKFNLGKCQQTSHSDIFRKACITNEVLGGSNKYYCESCCHYNEAESLVIYERLPKLMILHLNRFNTSETGVRKINAYMPTPLVIDCFCANCYHPPHSSKITEKHYFQLCCVVMHIGATMESGHYITYARASSDNGEFYKNCATSLIPTTFVTESRERSLKNIKSLLVPDINPFNESKLNVSYKSDDVKSCKDSDCCKVKLNNKNGSKDEVWLEYDDESVRSLTREELIGILGYKPNSTATPYLLFYSKIINKLENCEE